MRRRAGRERAQVRSADLLQLRLVAAVDRIAADLPRRACSVLEALPRDPRVLVALPVVLAPLPAILGGSRGVRRKTVYGIVERDCLCLYEAALRDRREGGFLRGCPPVSWVLAHHRYIGT